MVEFVLETSTSSRDCCWMHRWCWRWPDFWLLVVMIEKRCGLITISITINIIIIKICCLVSNRINNNNWCCVAGGDDVVLPHINFWWFTKIIKHGCWIRGAIGPQHPHDRCPTHCEHCTTFHAVTIHHNWLDTTTSCLFVLRDDNEHIPPQVRHLGMSLVGRHGRGSGTSEKCY